MLQNVDISNNNLSDASEILALSTLPNLIKLNIAGNKFSEPTLIKKHFKKKPCKLIMEITSPSEH